MHMSPNFIGFILLLSSFVHFIAGMSEHYEYRRERALVLYSAACLITFVIGLLLALGVIK